MGDTISNRFDRIDSTPALHPRHPAEETAVVRHPAMTTPTPAIPRERVTSARTAVFVIFTLAGLVFASWASRIADTKAALGLTAGELGLTLFAASVGSVTGLPLAGRISDRIGATRAVALGIGRRRSPGCSPSGWSSTPTARARPWPPGCSSSAWGSASGTSR